MENKMKRVCKGISALLSALMLLSPLAFSALADNTEEEVKQADIAGKVDPTQWVGVDGLGRELTTYSEAGDKKDKTVGVFYWTWHQELMSSGKVTNLTEFSALHPDAINDYDNPAWEDCTGAFFWNEPIYGYYSGADAYVLRKQAELLADADVDFVAFDCTNGSFTWDGATKKLLDTWLEAKNDGVDVPQVTFMLNFGEQSTSKTSVKNIYKKFYTKEKYADMWFCLDGKPLMIGYKSCLSKSDEEYDYFTWRANVASYVGTDKTNDYWGWLHVYPQALYTKNRGRGVEMTTVGVALNHNYELGIIQPMNGPNNMGRSYAKGDYSYSYTYRDKTVTVDANISDSKLYGRNFQQQWDYAISVDPEIIFVTGWNEWTAGRHNYWPPDQVTSLENAFPDQFDDENSRDCEPTKGDLKDHYYNQLVSNIRRYKGVTAPSVYASAKTIDVKGDVSQWDFDSVAIFNHYINNTYDRSNRGYGGIKYTNETMRNDIVQARVAYDNDNIYFYVRTVDELSPSTDNAWMRLFIDTQKATADSVDWEEYEYVINRVNPGEKATLERSTGGWNWEKAADVDYSVSGNVLQIAVPRSALGLENSLEFNFKWSDNMQTDGDIMDFYTNGDVAPGARFMFAFTGDITAQPGTSVDPVTDTATVTDGTSADGRTNTTVLVVVIVAGVAVAGGITTAAIVVNKKKR